MRKSVVNDRGTCKAGRGIDLPRAIAKQLGTKKAGVAPVIQIIFPYGKK